MPAQNLYHITLIGTIHSENGQCNSDELYKILEDINPEVIFDELTDRYADMYYSDSFDTYRMNKILLRQPAPVIPLEVKCIKEYMQHHHIEIVPVDIDTRQQLAPYEQEINAMFYNFFQHEEYKKLDEEIDALIATEGFGFLNSKRFSDYSAKTQMIEKVLIESEIEKNRLLELYQMFYSVQHDHREDTMLENVCRYSIDNPYNQAVFLIGAGHKSSVMRKIEGFENQSVIQLNWKMYANE
jgi:pheromone shutdown protein TraB